MEETSFPKSEKFPFGVLKQCAKENTERIKIWII